MAASHVTKRTVISVTLLTKTGNNSIFELKNRILKDYPQAKVNVVFSQKYPQKDYKNTKGSSEDFKYTIEIKGYK